MIIRIEREKIRLKKNKIKNNRNNKNKNSPRKSKKSKSIIKKRFNHSSRTERQQREIISSGGEVINS